ncbi:hypothetical protein LCGC14_1851060 [marine sediment metagenome]|uniref:Uncharacterized protein n=1 Tax=marine sediment metagenome TaxID=412755 RepID=A0A0F9GYN5_9ZZZZ
MRHRRIWLQVDSEEDVITTWASDKINDGDIEYVLVTELTRYKAVMEAAKRCVVQDQVIRKWPYLSKDVEHPLSKELQKHGKLMLELKEALKEKADG